MTQEQILTKESAAADRNSITIFRIVSDSASSFSIAFRSSCSWILWNFERFTQKKQCDGV